MASEVRKQISLRIVKGSFTYQNNPTSYSEDMPSPRGPSPGLVRVLEDGVDIDFSALTKPGRVVVQNLDAVNAVEWGLKIGGFFYPIGEIAPGEPIEFKFSRNFTVQETEPGTHQAPASSGFHMRAIDGDLDCRVECFDA